MSDSSNLNVLVVTEDRRVLRQISRFLAALGYQVETLAAADQVPFLLETNSPDFLLLDADPDLAGALSLCRSACVAEGPRSCYTFLMLGEFQAEAIEEALRAGVDDFLPKPIRYVELLARLRAGARSLEFERRWRRQNAVEPRTGLPNRWAFLESVRDSAKGQPNVRGACVLMELDLLDPIHRKHGHPTADALVRTIAERLRQASADGDVLASFGAGRFAIWLTNHSEAEAAEWAERLRASLAEADVTLGAATLRVTASFGVAAGESQPVDAEMLVDQAVAALEDTKSSGRNCVTRFDQHRDDTKTWAESVAQGRLLEQAVAGDLMTPCPLLLQPDYTIARAAAASRPSGLKFLPVIGDDGRLAGMIAAEALLAKPKAEAAADLRVGDVMTTDVAVVDEDAPLPVLMDLLLKESWPVVVILADDRPVGCVTADSLASLGARITPASFSPAQPCSNSTSYLVVPDLCPAGDGN